LIEKLHLYDIFGYFLPGIAMIGILWLPFGLLRGTWPGADWGSAVMTLAFTYILGLLLQGFAASAFSSSIVRAPDGHYRFPSDTVLDPNDLTLGAEKIRIAEVVSRKFGLDIRAGEPGDFNIDLKRRAAFLLARRTLAAEKASDSIDQFEGLYSLMRGLVAVLAVGFSYFAGWGASFFQMSWSARFAVIVTAAALLTAVNAAALLQSGLQFRYRLQFRSGLERLCAYALLLAFGSIGYGLGLKYQPHSAQAAALAVSAVAALLGSLRAYAAYNSFAYLFAVTVWRDFLVWSLKDMTDPLDV
jgi:hypothetical protein